MFKNFKRPYDFRTGNDPHKVLGFLWLYNEWFLTGGWMDNDKQVTSGWRQMTKFLHSFLNCHSQNKHYEQCKVIKMIWTVCYPKRSMIYNWKSHTLSFTALTREKVLFSKQILTVHPKRTHNRFEKHNLRTPFVLSCLG